MPAEQESCCICMPAHLQVLVQIISDDEIMCHPDSMRLHGVCGSVIKVSKRGIIEVRHLRAQHRSPCATAAS